MLSRGQRSLSAGAGVRAAATGLALGAGGACAKGRARARRPAGAIACYDLQAKENSPATRALFAERHCQGGGVTWAAILDVLLGRMGRVQPVLEPTPGWTGGVSTLNGDTRFSIDDGSDVARFCADDNELVEAIRREHHRLNNDAAELRRVMLAAPSMQMECLEPDGGLPPMPAGLKLPPLRPGE